MCTQCWDLPKLETIQNTGRDWILPLLKKLDDVTGLMVLMILWRIWHCHNEITHEKVPPPFEVSKRFLCSYVEFLLMFKQCPQADAVKGKGVVNLQPGARRDDQRVGAKEKQKWTPPAVGRVKLNTDGSFIQSTGEACAGMILRIHLGEVLFVACRSLQSCSSALEAELSACEEGIKVALNWSMEPITLEMDCSVALAMIQDKKMDSSRLVHQVLSIQECLEERDIQIMKIDRSQNEASHILANFGRSSNRTQFWIGNCPNVVQNCVSLKCKTVMF
uniref:Uncharacterized protein n=2 Tax=Avena sativa TaxID=4498 RepID=A0ACD5WE24_AVESA